MLGLETVKKFHHAEGEALLNLLLLWGLQLLGDRLHAPCAAPNAQQP